MKYSKLLSILLLLAAAVSSCSSVEKQAKKKVSWLLVHDLLDDACFKYYPVVDSAGEIIRDTVRVENEDYTRLLDSLQKRMDTIRQAAAADRFRAEKGHEECLSVVDAQAEVIKRMERTVADVKSRYKPCEPVVIKETQTVWRTDPAEASRLKGIILEQETRVQKAQDTANTWAEKAERQGKWKWYFFGLLFLNILYAIFRLFIYKRPI